MDLQKFVDGFKSMTCVVSVEKLDNGSYGTIRIVTGNKAYIESIEKSNSETPDMLTNKFIPNQEYQCYFPKDLNFEDFCYRCAVLKEPMHTYIHPERYNFWFNIFMLPIDIDDEHIAYCTYTQELTQKPDTEKMSNLSYEAASTVLNTCIKLHGTDNFEKSMGNVITDIRNICKADYGCIIMVDFFTKNYSLLCEDLNDTAAVSMHRENWFTEDFFKLAGTWEDCISGSNCIIIKNEYDMDFIRKKDPAWLDFLQNENINSFMLFPLKTGCELLGYILLLDFEIENAVQLKETLSLVSYFIASEISNFQLFDRLRIVSTIDMLTGVFNRNEMNDRVTQLSLDDSSGSKNIGVIFADLNGLKKINDDKGHSAGDILLKDAAKILKETFPDDEIFRAGGDEFMVLMRNIREDVLSEKAKELKERMNNTEYVRFAIGTCFDNDCRNIHRAMKIADGKMYEDKKLFYESNPEMRRSSMG